MAKHATQQPKSQSNAPIHLAVRHARLQLLPRQLKRARLMLGLSQIDLAALAQMQQKDISLHENKTHKALLPLRYMLALYERGIDLNSLVEDGEVRVRGVVSERTRENAVQTVSIEERLRTVEIAVLKLQVDDTLADLHSKLQHYTK